MNRPEFTSAFRSIMANAARELSTATEPHVADDEELLELWSSGYLDEARRRGLVEHLGKCRDCAKKVADLIALGAIEPPLVPETSENPESPLADAPLDERKPGTASPLAVGVTAAAHVAMAGTATVSSSRANASPRRSHTFARRVLLLAAGVTAAGLAAVIYFGGGSGQGDPLAMADAEFQKGDWAAAFGHAETVLLQKSITVDNVKSIDADRAEKAATIATQAAERLAAKRLAAGDFPGVAEVSRRASNLGVQSARLANNDLQAARGERREVAIGPDASLLDFDYDARGNSVQKSLPVADEKFEQLRSRWETALAEHPRQIELWLNFGHLLLRSGAVEEAKRRFEGAVAIDSNDVRGHLG
ncbi:MAG TPA: hypothetical protein PLV92_23050, partial [Pirellulaceae bacterium]|nr:hypothetical protein [Pirellulaceae bacterium]